MVYGWLWIPQCQVIVDKARSINWMGRNKSELVLDGINGNIYVHHLRIYFFAGYLADWPWKAAFDYG